MAVRLPAEPLGTAAVPTAAVPRAVAPGIGPVIVLLSMIAFGSAMSMRVMDAAIPRLATDSGGRIR